MTTKLTTPIKREIDLEGEKYTVTLTADGLKLVQKGKRNGVELAWKAVVSGDAALATALQASASATPQH